MLAHPLVRLPAALLLVVSALQLSACASLPAPAERAVSTAFAERSAPTALQRIAADSAPADRPAASGFRLLPGGADALDARIALAQRAEATVDLQVYHFADDDSGRQLLRALRDAARRGVRVRVLVDDLHAQAALPLLAGLASFANAEVRLYNPLPARAGSVVQRVLGSMHELDRINRRMHNKLFIADNALAIAGGRNIGDEYFMRSTVANFIDLDVLARGPVVDELSALFDRFWNSDHAWPVLALADRPDGTALRARFDAAVDAAQRPIELPAFDVLGQAPLSAQLDAGRLPLHAAPVRLVADAPGKPDGAFGPVDATLTLIAQASAQVTLATPYFVPGDDGLAVLQAAAARGAKLRLMTNSLGATDEPLVHVAYARYRPTLLALGAEVTELSPTLGQRTRALGSFGRSAARLHAKVTVVDGRHVVLGSMNLDHRSRRLNTELALLIDSPALAQDLARLAQPAALTGSYRVRLADAPAPAADEHAAAAPQLQWLERGDDGERLLAAEPGQRVPLALKLALLSLLIGEEQL